tara:strand:+ start:85 stop:618 length:534 start_codon:yes stop_codon:yes gene_type:complete
MKNYREIEFGFGNIEEAVKELKSHKDLVKGTFNGQILYSDIDDMDSAYKKVTGKTKTEFDEAERLRQIEYKQQEKEHKEAIPKLTIEWVKKGVKILDKKHHKLWTKIVPIRLGDLYKGMELGNCLEIVEQLNKGTELEEVKPLIENQGHSGMSFGLVCSMVRELADRGNEFVEYARA